VEQGASHAAVSAAGSQKKPEQGRCLDAKRSLAMINKKLVCSIKIGISWPLTRHVEKTEGTARGTADIACMTIAALRLPRSAEVTDSIMLLMQTLETSKAMRSGVAR
jgi:hypothetical protein